MNKEKRKAIFQKLSEVISEPTTELLFNSPFELLIAVLLSAQATDISVNKATKTLFAVANTPQQMITLGYDGIVEHIRSIGLYKTKAEHILKTCHDLIHQFDNKVPQTREELESLAGVGRKTANVVLNTAFGQPTIAVDTHIFRVCNRTKLAVGKNVREVEDKLEQVTPKEYKQDAHHLLILHGRYTCQARKPKCTICAIASLCEFTEKSS